MVSDHDHRGVKPRRLVIGRSCVHSEPSATAWPSCRAGRRSAGADPADGRGRESGAGSSADACVRRQLPQRRAHEAAAAPCGVSQQGKKGGFGGLGAVRGAAHGARRVGNRGRDGNGGARREARHERGGSGAVRGAEHCARRVMNRGRCGHRQRQAVASCQAQVTRVAVTGYWQPPGLNVIQVVPV